MERVLSANSPNGCSAKSACYGSRLRASRGGAVCGHPPEVSFAECGISVVANFRILKLDEDYFNED